MRCGIVRLSVITKIHKQRKKVYAQYHEIAPINENLTDISRLNLLKYGYISKGGNCREKNYKCMSGTDNPFF